MIYFKVSDYVTKARSLLQDMIAPYRYSDADIVGALNVACEEISTLRPDLYLDVKYQQPLQRGDIDDGSPGLFTTARMNEIVPVPSKYAMSVSWYISGFLQLYDVTDTQDQRAQAFMTKFQQQLLTLSSS